MNESPSAARQQEKQGKQDRSDRLRTHPEERFAAPQHLIDLDRATAELRAEGGPGGRAAGQRHRQKTLYRHGQATVALFLFDKGAQLAAHKAAGTVVIQVLDGQLQVDAEGGERHQLTPGQLLVLAPSVVHDVSAEEPSRMLLTVHLETPR
jgi:quercetin dioxygenase-like cupin family protein